MTRLTLATTALLILSSGSIADPGPLSYASTPDAVLSQIGDRGASEVSVELYNSPSWIPAMRRVEAGERDWLLVALALAPGTDGAATTDLSLSISRALLTNPEAVLELFLSTSPPRLDLCRGWAEFAGHNSFEDAFAEVEAKIQKLREVSEPSLRSYREACIEKLRASEARLRKIYSSPVE